MKRSIEAIAAADYDVIVVGGGIHGSWVAHEAAQQGLSVCLLEKGDFGHATSANSLKIIHGGIRYLQKFDIGRMRESMREQTVLMDIAPHLVHPLPILLPCSRGWKNRLFTLRVAGILNDMLRMGEGGSIPRTKTLSAAACSELTSYRAIREMDGALLWHDAQVHNSERLVISILHSATAAGAQIANYADVTSLIRSGSRVDGVEIRDVIDGGTYRIRARLTVVTAGPWSSSLLPDTEPIPLIKGINLVIKRPPPGEFAIGLERKCPASTNAGMGFETGRFFFLVPWRRQTMIGTYYFRAGNSDLTLKESEIDEFRREINRASSLDIKPDEIAWIHAGLLPALPAGNGIVRLAERSLIRDHGRENGISGLISLVGIKYTTARAEARKAVALCNSKLGRSVKISNPRTPVFGGDISCFSQYADQEAKNHPAVDPSWLKGIISNYGSEYSRVINRDSSRMRSRISNRPFLTEEILFAAREEMAVRLTDVLLRRTDIGYISDFDDSSLVECCTILAEELGWDEQRKQLELANARRVLQARWAGPDQP